jgi:hypothetical protein
MFFSPYIIIKFAKIVDSKYNNMTRSRPSILRLSRRSIERLAAKDNEHWLSKKTLVFIILNRYLDIYCLSEAPGNGGEAGEGSSSSPHNNFHFYKQNTQKD